MLGASWRGVPSRARPNVWSAPVAGDASTQGKPLAIRKVQGRPGDPSERPSADEIVLG